MDYPTVISPEEIWDVYVPMGFSNFKIEGRTGNLYNLIETYVFYLIKPEYQGKARILLYTEKCRNCFARFYCSGGCAANSYNFHHSLTDAYDIGCVMQKKRIECAIMIKAALAEMDENEEMTGDIPELRR